MSGTVIIYQNNSYLKRKQRLLIVNPNKDFAHNQLLAENWESEPSAKRRVAITLEHQKKQELSYCKFSRVQA